MNTLKLSKWLPIMAALTAATLAISPMMVSAKNGDGPNGIGAGVGHGDKGATGASQNAPGQTKKGDEGEDYAPGNSENSNGVAGMPGNQGVNGKNVGNAGGIGKQAGDDGGTDGTTDGGTDGTTDGGTDGGTADGGLGGGQGIGLGGADQGPGIGKGAGPAGDGGRYSAHDCGRHMVLPALTPNLMDPNWDPTPFDCMMKL